MRVLKPGRLFPSPVRSVRMGSSPSWWMTLKYCRSTHKVDGGFRLLFPRPRKKRVLPRDGSSNANGLTRPKAPAPTRRARSKVSKSMKIVGELNTSMFACKAPRFKLVSSFSRHEHDDFGYERHRNDKWRSGPAASRRTGHSNPSADQTLR